YRSTVDQDRGPLTDPLPPSYRSREPQLPPTEGDDAMTGSPMSQELIDLRGRMRRFIDEEVIPAEPAFFEEQERGGFASATVLQPLRAAAKAQGLWALGHPAEIGGGGVSFMDFVYLNEIIGRSELGQLAVGSVSMQDSIMLHRYGSEEHKQRWLRPMV